MSTPMDLGLIPVPKRLRHDPERPFPFGLLILTVFGFSSTFIVANLYYCQPILLDLAKAFQVDNSRVSRIPTLVQAGYAAGLLLISPLGDLVRRRQLILVLVIISTALTVGLAITSNVEAFSAITFIVGAVSVVPQILLPLAADLAPPHRRASAMSIVLTGLLFGVLLARVLAGIITQFATYRVVYYFAIAVQALVFLLIYTMIPDYPAKNKEMTYWGILWTMAKFSVTEPLLIQSCFVNVASSAIFSNFWVTLTFLLGGPPYHYSTLVIGLFGLLGMFGVMMGPVIGLIVDRLVPWYGNVVSTIFLGIFSAVEVGAGGINIAAVIITTLGTDIFRQANQVSLSTKLFSIAPEARARFNAVFLLSLFLGQVMGTSVGTKVFLQNGWRPAAALSVAWAGWMLLVLLLRGPHCGRYTWFGYEGGLQWRKSVADAQETGKEVERETSAGTNTIVAENEKQDLGSERTAPDLELAMERQTRTE